MKLQAIIENQPIDCQLSLSGNEVIFEVDNNRQSINFVRLTPFSYSLIINGKSYYVTITKHFEGYNITIDQNVFFVKIKDENELLLEKFGMSDSVTVSNGEVRAPIPGLVSSIAVVPGQSVQKGENLLVLEAMKMENDIDSPSTGCIKEVFVSQGQSVEKNCLLIQLELNENERG